MLHHGVIALYTFLGHEGRIGGYTRPGYRARWFPLIQARLAVSMKTS